MFQPSTCRPSRAWVEVDLDALCANAERVRRAAGPAARLLPMVKANAYGLGTAEVARALADAVPASALAGFGVAAVAEGEALRKVGWAGRILVLAPAPPGDFDRAASSELTLCISDLESAERWAAAAERVSRPLAMHAEVDTGMGRAGFAWDRAGDWGAALLRVTAGRLAWEGVFTHFHSADEPDLAPAREQWERFTTALASLPAPAARSAARVVHTSNSAAAMRCGFPGDWVRPGIFLYGGRVGAEPPRPVVSVRARVALIRDVPAGTSVGYAATYRARREERWGTLSIGYGDGLRRAIGPAGSGALVHGRRVPIVGRISMDMTVVDLTEVPDVRAGDVATLIGTDGAAEISLDEVAEQAGTISYEILTGLTPRLERVYIGSRPSPGLPCEAEPVETGR